MADQQQGFFARMAQDPAVKELLTNVGSFATAKAQSVADRQIDKRSPGEDTESVIDAGKKEAKKRAVMPAIKGFFSGAWKKLTKGSKGGKRPHNILETAIIAAPVEMVWDEWKNFEQWPSFMKGPESVKQEKSEDGTETTNWTAKVFIHRRQWKSTITEEVEHERLRWKSEAAKGQVDGMVAFSPAGENLTFCVLVLEYRPKGFFEAVGKLWRVAGRRARLDFKHFQRHIAMADQSDALGGGEQGDDDRDERQPDDGGTGEGTGEPAVTEDTGEAGRSDEGTAEPGGTGEPTGTGGTGDAGGTGTGDEGGTGADQEPATTSS